MLMRNLIGKFNSINSLHINKPNHAFEPLFKSKNSSASLACKRQNNCKLSVECLKNTSLVARNGKNKRNWVVGSSVEPGPPTPSGPPFNPFWILGIVMTALITFIGQKWPPLKNRLTEGRHSRICQAVCTFHLHTQHGSYSRHMPDKIDAALNKVEDVVEAVEEGAEKVEKVAEDIANDLPAGGQLRRAVDYVERIAEKAAKYAGLVDDFIDEVQEKLETYAESLQDEDKDKEPAQKPDETGTQKIERGNST